MRASRNFLKNLKAMKQLGSKGEDLAAKFLKDRGFKILSKNFKTPIGEVDIIAEHRKTIVFVEVKTRTNTAFGKPFEAVNLRKREKLKKLALFYIKHHRSDMPVRFDVLSIEMDGENGRIEHIEDAFE